LSSRDPLKLTIIDEQNGRFQIQVAVGSRSSADNPLLLPFRGNTADLRVLNESLSQELELASVEFGSGFDGTPRTAGIALSRVRQSGVKVIDDLLGEAEGSRFRFLMEEALRTATPSNPGAIELASPLRLNLPIEILPSAPISLASLPSDETGLQSFARAFPAYTAVVKRVVTEVNRSPYACSDEAPSGLFPQDLTIYRAPEVTVAFYWHQDAPASAEDRAYFVRRAADSGQLPRVRLFGPVPDADFVPPSPEAFRELAQLIVSPPVFRHPEDSTDTPYQLVHIAAHSESGLPGVSQASRVLLGRHVERKQRFRKVTRTETYPLGSGLLYELSRSPGTRMDRGPIGVLSACQSTMPSAVANVELVEPLLHAGYRCVVGFATNVTGPVAHSVFVKAYDCLLQEASIGRAIQQARTWLLLKRNNPGALALTSFGETDLVLELGVV
jgi:hypothetical protein